MSWPDILQRSLILSSTRKGGEMFTVWSLTVPGLVGLGSNHSDCIRMSLLLSCDFRTWTLWVSSIYSPLLRGVLLTCTGSGKLICSLSQAGLESAEVGVFTPQNLPNATNWPFCVSVSQFAITQLSDIDQPSAFPQPCDTVQVAYVVWISLQLGKKNRSVLFSSWSTEPTWSSNKCLHVFGRGQRTMQIIIIFIWINLPSLYLSLSYTLYTVPVVIDYYFYSSQ